MSLPLTPITELDAVNVCLLNINESPVNSLNSIFGDALMAQNLLHNTSRRIQEMGLACNTEYNFPIEPTAQTSNSEVTLTISGSTITEVPNGTVTLPLTTYTAPTVLTRYQATYLGQVYTLQYQFTTEFQWQLEIADTDFLVYQVASEDGENVPNFEVSDVTIKTYTGTAPSVASAATGASEGGEILLPTDALKTVIRVERDITERNLVERGRRLYDRLNHTYNIGKAVNVDLVRFLEWEDLPQVVRNYITIHAARQFQVQVVGDTENYQLTEKDELEAHAEFVREQTDTEQVNMLWDSHSVFEVMHRTRQHPSYTNF